MKKIHVVCIVLVQSFCVRANSPQLVGALEALTTGLGDLNNVLRGLPPAMPPQAAPVVSQQAPPPPPVPLLKAGPKFSKVASDELKGKAGNVFIDKNGRPIRYKIGILEEGNDKGKLAYWGPFIGDVAIENLVDDQGDFIYPYQRIQTGDWQVVVVLHDPKTKAEIAQIDEKRRQYNEQLETLIKKTIVTRIKKLLPMLTAYTEAIQSPGVTIEGIKNIPRPELESLISDLQFARPDTDFGALVDVKTLGLLKTQLEKKIKKGILNRKEHNGLGQQVDTIKGIIERRVAEFNRELADVAKGRQQVRGILEGKISASLSVLEIFQKLADLISSIIKQTAVGMNQNNLNAQKLYDKVLSGAMVRGNLQSAVSVVPGPGKDIGKLDDLGKVQIETKIKVVKKSLGALGLTPEKESHIRQLIEKIEGFLNDGQINEAVKSYQLLNKAISSSGKNNSDEIPLT